MNGLRNAVHQARLGRDDMYRPLPRLALRGSNRDNASPAPSPCFRVNQRVVPLPAMRVPFIGLACSEDRLVRGYMQRLALASRPLSL